MSWQNFQAIGNLGKDPSIKFSQTGKAVCNFSIALNQGSGDKKTTLWLNVVCFDKTAERAAELAKGGRCLVVGRIEQDEWNDKATGEKRTSLKCVASTVYSLSGDKQPAPLKQGKPKFDDNASSPLGDDEIPF